MTLLSSRGTRGKQGVDEAQRLKLCCNHTDMKLEVERLSPELEFDVQDSEEDEEINHDDDQTLKNMEQEIECPRCYDIMTLSSNFDRLGYICQECDLLLVMK
jgi:hypothetical protein